jgi:hypothetical protein
MIWIAFWVLVSFVLALSFGLSAAWREIDALHKDLGNAKDELINVANIMTVLEATGTNSEYPSTHKKCMHCGEIMLWEEYCECLKEIGRDIRRKATETWGDGIRGARRKPKKSVADDDRGTAKSPSLF